MKVMKTISDVKDVQPKTLGIVQRMRHMINTLKKQGIVVQEKGVDALQEVDNNYQNFEETAQLVFKVKADILPLQTQEAINIKKRIEAFGRKIREFRQDFLNTLPFGYSDSYTMEMINNSYAVIDQYNAKLNAIKEEAESNRRLEELFELEPSEYKQLRECTTDLKNVKWMWDAIAMVNYQYKDWQGQLWKRINADNLLEKNKVLQTQLKNLKEIRHFRGYPNIVN